MMSITETHTSSSESSQRCDLHIRTRLLIRRFGFESPGAHQRVTPCIGSDPAIVTPSAGFTRDPARTVRATSKLRPRAGRPGGHSDPRKTQIEFAFAGLAVSSPVPAISLCERRTRQTNYDRAASRRGRFATRRAAGRRTTGSDASRRADPRSTLPCLRSTATRARPVRP
jgi:hypothetical protein